MNFSNNENLHIQLITSFVVISATLTFLNVVPTKIFITRKFDISTRDGVQLTELLLCAQFNTHDNQSQNFSVITVTCLYADSHVYIIQLADKWLSATVYKLV